MRCAVVLRTPSPNPSLHPNSEAIWTHRLGFGIVYTWTAWTLSLHAIFVHLITILWQNGEWRKRRCPALHHFFTSLKPKASAKNRRLTRPVQTSRVGLQLRFTLSRFSDRQTGKGFGLSKFPTSRKKAAGICRSPVTVGTEHVFGDYNVTVTLYNNQKKTCYI